MIKSVSQPIFHPLILVLLCLAAVPVLAAELRLIDGEYRYYENGELVSHQTHLRALPEGEQTAIAMAVAASEPTEANPESTSLAIAQASRIFEIEPDPGTDEKIGDPVCVIASFQSEVSTEIEGAISAASASAGGRDGTADADADENIPSASASTSAPDATLSVDPLSGDLFIENEFASITVSGDDADNSTGNHQFIALIGDSIDLRVGSYAASAAVYPDSAIASAFTQIGAELQADVLDCQLSLTALVDTGEGSIQADPDQGSYQFGDEVQLTATPEEGWSFVGWSGDAAGTDNPLLVTIANNTEIFASFEINTLTIGGTLSGLAAGNSVTLQNNNNDDLTLTVNGEFTFSTAIDDLTDYEVTVLDQPDGQFCSVANASGTLAGNDIDDVAVDCVNIELGLSLSAIQFTGLNPGDGADQVLTLTNTGQADLLIEQFIAPNAPFGFDPQDCAPLPRTLTPGQSCTVMLSFEPQAAGDFDDELLIVSSAMSSPDSISLSGSAAPPAVPVPTLGLPALLLMLFGMFLLSLRRTHQ